MEHRALRTTSNPPLAHYRARFRSLHLPTPFTVDAFRAQLETRRGRPLRLHPLPGYVGAGTACGMIVALADGSDHVFVEMGTRGVHRDQIITHELMHLACGHVGTTDGDLVHVATRLLHEQGVDPGLIRLILGRACYTSAEEREAETLASLALHRPSALGLDVRGSSQEPASPEAGVLRRLYGSLAMSIAD